MMVIAVLMLSLSACYYDNEEELYPGSAGSGECDTVNITYAAVISKITATSCALSGCHQGTNASRTIGSFENHEETKKYLDLNKQRFIDAINHNAGAPSMPKGGSKLAPCDIKKIEKWISKGYLNN